MCKSHNPALNRTCAKSRAARLALRLLGGNTNDLMKRYILGLKVVLLLAALNSVLWLVLPHFIPDLITNILLNIARTGLVLWAGWLVVTERIGGLWGAALGGALVLLVDHPIVGGGYFLLTGEREAFVGVLISYVMFVWVTMLFGWLGGFAGAKLAHTKG
jgi:hypothetical protein